MASSRRSPGSGSTDADHRSRAPTAAPAHSWQLPPGIRKNLARSKPLPPGIAKRYAPAAMLSRLPAHRGHEWCVAGTDLMLVAIGTAVVVDILLDVFG